MRHWLLLGEALAWLLLAQPCLAGSIQGRYQGGPPEVLMFSLPDCVHCKRARLMMRKNHIPFREIDISTEEGRNTAAAMRIPMLAPVFSYRDKVLEGYTEEGLLRFIEN